MKLLSSIVALAVFGKVVPALAVRALCRLAQNSLSDFFESIQKLCCPPTLDASNLVVGTTITGGGINCVYGNNFAATGKCYYVSTQFVVSEMANVSPPR